MLAIKNHSSGKPSNAPVSDPVGHHDDRKCHRDTIASDRGGNVGVPRKCLLRIRIVVPAASAASSIQLNDVPEGHRYEDLATIVNDPSARPSTLS